MRNGIKQEYYINNRLPHSFCEIKDMRLNEFPRIEKDPIPWEINHEWYYHPYIQNLLIHKKSNKLIIINKGEYEIRSVETVNNGYRYYNGIPFSRIKADAFLEYPDTSVQILINHCDGNKLNDDLDNYEWVTYRGNLIHSFMNGLRTDNKPVVLTDLKSGVSEHFYSLAECAKRLNVNPGRITDYLKKKRNFPFLFKWDLKVEGLTDNKLTKDHLCRVAPNSPKPFKVKDVHTGEVKVYAFVKEMADDFNVSDIYLPRYKNKLYRERYEIVNIDDPDELIDIWMTHPSYGEWRKDKMERDVYSKPKNIKTIVYEVDGKKEYYPSSREFAEAKNLNHRHVPKIVKRGVYCENKIYYC